VELHVFLAVIAAAAMHAGWNAMLKIRLDPFLAVVLVNAVCGLIALPLGVWLGLPKLAAWPWIVASVLIHLAYYLTLTGAYRRADLGQVYPVARGSAPLVTTLISLFVLGEPIGGLGVLGVAVLGLGIMTMAFGAGRLFDRQALALATGITITAYTLVDGVGARIAGSPHVYSAWLFSADGLFLTTFALAWRKPLRLRPALGFVMPGLAGGVMSLAAYWIAIWAMTVAPIGLVAAVRESSVLFGALLSVAVLHEPLRPNRLVAAILIVAGLAMIRLQG
jgi:drug/metabolite transporter (DMT)-like permease